MEQPSNDVCKGTAGKVVPVIDRNRCEAKEDCVRVCPYNVFAVRKLGADEKASLSLLGRLRAFAHGNRQAFVVRPEACHACQLCIPGCPEQAIRLVPLRP